MKKMAFALIGLTLAAAPAFAGSTKADIKVTGKVLPSCVMVFGQDASFDYTAANGSSNAVPGIATVNCNNGTIFNAFLQSAGGAIDLHNGSNVLHANLGFTYPSVQAASGVYAGGQSMTYVYNPSAAAGQWGAPNGAYTNTYTVTVTF